MKTREPNGIAGPHGDALLAMTVDELVDRWPDTLGVLAPLGIDICCGGGRRVGEAIGLHGGNVDEFSQRLERVIAISGQAR